MLSFVFSSQKHKKGIFKKELNVIVYVKKLQMIRFCLKNVNIIQRYSLQFKYKKTTC